MGKRERREKLGSVPEICFEGRFFLPGSIRLPRRYTQPGQADAGQATSNPNTLAALLSRLSKQLNATPPGATARISQAAANWTLS